MVRPTFNTAGECRGGRDADVARPGCRLGRADRSGVGSHLVGVDAKGDAHLTRSWRVGYYCVPSAGLGGHVPGLEPAWPLAAAAVGPGDDLQQVAVGVFEVHA